MRGLLNNHLHDSIDALESLGSKLWDQILLKLKATRGDREGEDSFNALKILQEESSSSRN